MKHTSVAIPYLTILALIVFAIGALSTIHLYIHIYAEVLRTPLISSYAIACYSNDKVIITITIRLERGEVVVLRRVQLTSEEGLLTIDYPYTSLSEISTELVGFEGILMPGQVGRIVIMVPLKYYMIGNKTYHSILLFDKATALASFEIAPCEKLSLCVPDLFYINQTLPRS